jgi:hypothetical protein
VPDRALRVKLTPAYTMGCKRILLSDDYMTYLAVLDARAPPMPQ